MKATGILTAALMALSATTYGQTAAQSPATARRDNLRMMEGALTNAVRNGADKLGREMQVSAPGSIIVTGTARARGFTLDGYGVFFVVDVPMMKQSVIWSMQVLLQKERRDFLREFIANSPEGPARRQAEAQLRTLEGQSAAAPSQVAQSVPQGVAAAQSVTETPAMADSRDPNELYTEAVKTALIDAMLTFGGQLIGPDESLTIAAQDSEGPPTPGQFYDASTIVLRVKGSDLAALQSGKLTRDEVVKKVEVREF